MKKLFSLLLFNGVVFCAVAQSVEVTGKVTDQSNSPLANASILEKGTICLKLIYLKRSILPV